MKESDQIELKRELNDKLEKEVVAFLNSKTGGEIFIGVCDDGTDVFHVSEHFVEISFPFANQFQSVKEDITLSREQAREQVREQVSEQVSEQVKSIVSVMQIESSSILLMSKLHLNSRQYFVNKYLNPAIEAGFVELTQPDSPKSPTQKYRLTSKGLSFKQQLTDKKDNE